MKVPVLQLARNYSESCEKSRKSDYYVEGSEPMSVPGVPMKPNDPKATPDMSDAESVAGSNGYQQNFQTLDMAFLGSLVPGLIHNMATPLSGVLGATQLLERRASSLEELLRANDHLNEAERAELDKQFERTRTNVDILARNAKHLADILQIIVQRITRGNAGAEEYYSLSELVQNELRFLEANLNFKHKVKKQVTLGVTLPTAKYVYGHVASALDEFVINTMSQHDLRRGIMEMDFSTEADATHVSVVVEARFVPLSDEAPEAGPLESYLARLRESGWLATQESNAGVRKLRLACPRRVLPA
jgi:signal transduction histidine kinase